MDAYSSKGAWSRQTAFAHSQFEQCAIRRHLVVMRGQPQQPRRPQIMQRKKKKKKKKGGILDSLWPAHHQRQLIAGMPERGWQCPRLVLRLRIETRGVARPFGSRLAGWLSEESSALKRRELTMATEFPDWEMPSWFSLRRPHAGRSAGWRRTRINAGINLKASVWTVPRNYFRIILCVCGCATSSRRGRRRWTANLELMKNGCLWLSLQHVP
ncbi:uncharacterized protein IWZ02DRAFT_241394 [Phyllosticta citriasiana]|uniref:uncharacterized protein n=1 Tax=Phyllosticta citriasiana TaxID=595635 RepID=UPI0030FD5FD0